MSTYFRNTLIKGHGEIDISTFIVVPKNTLILTFVYEGRYLADYNKDYGGIHKSFGKVRSQAVNLLHFWIDYLYKLLEFYQTKQIGIVEIKRQMSAFSLLKKKYLEKYRMHRPDYSLTNDDIVVYFEDDIVPNQMISMKNTHLPGIYNFEKIIFGSRTRYDDSLYDDQDPKSLFYQILNSVPPEKETRGVYLIDVLGEMEKRIAQNRLPNSKQSIEPVNIVFVYACRGAKYDLTIKQHLSFLYKNIFYHFEKKQKQDAEETKNSATTFSQKVTKRLDVLDSQISVDKNLIYKIFYEKYCIISPSQADLASFRCLLYYQDAEILAAKKDRDARQKKNDFIVPEGKNYLEIKRVSLNETSDDCIFGKEKLNWYADYIPARDIEGNAIDIWKTGDLISRKEGEEFFDNRLPFNNRQEQQVFENFYLPRNQNTEIFLTAYFGYDDLSFEGYLPGGVLDFFMNKEFREKIFNEWKQLMIPYLNEDLKLDNIYIEIMYECFVRLNSLKKKSVKDLINQKLDAFFLVEKKDEKTDGKNGAKVYASADKKRLIRKNIKSIFDSFSKTKSMKKEKPSFKRHFRIFTTENFNTLFYNQFFALSGPGDKTLHFEEQNKSFVHFKNMYQKELSREKTFPYLTPIEFMIANYYVSRKKVISSFSDLIKTYRKKGRDIPMTEKKEYGMCNYNILIPIYQSLENLFINYKSFSFTNCIKSIESFFRFYYDQLFSKYLQTGIENFNKSKNVSQYLTIFSGYFMMKLDHVLDYFRLDKNINDAAFICPWIYFYKNKIYMYPKNINYAYVSKRLSRRFSLIENKIYRNVYNWIFPMIGDQISYFYWINLQKERKMIGIETKFLETEKGKILRKKSKAVEFSVKSRDFFLSSPKLLLRYFRFFMFYLNFMGLIVNYEKTVLDIIFATGTQNSKNSEDDYLQVGKFLNFFSVENFRYFHAELENPNRGNSYDKENNLVQLLRVAKSLGDFGFSEFSIRLYLVLKDLLLGTSFSVVLNRSECEYFLKYLYIMCFDKKYQKTTVVGNVLMHELELKGENARLAQVIKSFAKKI